MIRFGQKAFAHCDATGCQHSTEGKLVLMRAGGFGFAPSGHGWRFGGSGGAWETLCPEHAAAMDAAKATADKASMLDQAPAENGGET